jgi:hypothetical protein
VGSQIHTRGPLKITGIRTMWGWYGADCVGIPDSGQNMTKIKLKPDSIPKKLTKIQYSYSIPRFKPYS